MKKKLYIKRFFAVISLVLAVLLFLGISQEYFFSKLDHSKLRVTGFYEEEKNSLDVCFIGSSECYTGFSPVQFYRETGITSYPYCSESNPISMTKYQLKEILRTQNPQLIFIEINGALYGKDKDFSDLPHTHKALDAMPMNKNKDDAIRTIIPDENKAEFYFPFIKYHGAWDCYIEQLQYAKSKFDMQLRGYSLLKGTSVYTKTSLKGADKGKIIDTAKLQKDNKTLELNKNADYYLRDLLQFCKDEKLDNVVFVRFPHIVDKRQYDRFKRTNRAGEIIEEYGFDFINFEKNQIDINLDKNTDFYNSDHMNINGQLKLTEYISNIIQNDYNVKPHELTESQKKNWDECADFYDAYLEYAQQETEKNSNKRVTEKSDIMKEIKKIQLEK